MGTKLTVEIDCEVLQKENPKIFYDCGWNTCENYLYIFGKVPKKLYTLWVSNLFDEMTILQFGSKNKCLGHMIKLKDEEQKGIKVTWYGNEVT